MNFADLAGASKYGLGKLRRQTHEQQVERTGIVLKFKKQPCSPPLPDPVNPKQVFSSAFTGFMRQQVCTSDVHL